MKIKLMMRKKRINAEFMVRLIISVLILLFSFIIPIDSADFLFFALVAMNLYCAVKCRDNNALFLVYLFLAWSNYSIYIYYWTESINMYSMYKWFLQYDDVMHSAAYSLYIFGAVLFTGCPKLIKRTTMLSNNSSGNNSIFSGGKTSICMTYVFIGVIALISGWSMFIRLTRGYVPSSALYEYLVVFFIIAFFLSSGNRKLDYIISFFIIINCIYVFSNGERIAAVQFALVFFLRFLMHRLPKNIMLFGIIIGIVGLNAIGMWRGFTSFNVDYLANSVKELFRTGLVLDTAYSAEASGLAMIKLAQDYSIFGRIRLSVIYILYTFLGSKPFGIESNLVRLAQQQYPYSTGGGVLPCFGFFYLGYIGVILLGIVVEKYLKMIGKYNIETSNYKKCLAAFIFASFMRWYLYSPSPLFRGALLFTLVFFVATKLRIRV